MMLVVSYKNRNVIGVRMYPVEGALHDGGSLSMETETSMPR